MKKPKAETRTKTDAEIETEALRLKEFLAREAAAKAGQKKARGKGKDSIAARLNRFVDEAELFLNQDRTPFATVSVNGRRQTHAIEGKGFKDWLIYRFVGLAQAAPPREKLKDAIARAAALALHGNTQFRTWLRVGWGDNGRHYLDLGDETWRAVETDAGGWRVVDNPPIKFRRSGRETPLPEPLPSMSNVLDSKGNTQRIHTDSLRYLMALVRTMVPDDREQSHAAYRLLLGFMVDCLRPGGDHAILNFLGPPGAAKTSAAEAVIAMVDPREPATTGVPKTEDDLMVTASARNVMAIDNVSQLNAALADAYCRLTTGGGTEKRELYTSGEVFIIKACCPIIITSLETPTSRDDFQRRCINLNIASTPAAKRLEKEEVRELVAHVRPGVLGNLLDGVSLAIRRRDETRSRLRGHLPALADLMVWVEAAAPALGMRDGEFFTAFKDHKQRAVIDAAASDRMVQAIVELLADQPGREFTGTPSVILEALRGRITPGDMYEAREWLPSAAHALGDRLQSKVPVLLAAGVRHTSWTNKKTHNREYHLTLGEGVPMPDKPDDVLAAAEGGLG